MSDIRNSVARAASYCIVKRLLLILLFTASASAETIQWMNGRWFDGTTFRAATFYSVDGVLRTKAPKRVDRTVDLGGRYVIPPFGDAHHHGIDGPPDLDAKIRQFLDGGIFYVKNPNVIPDYLTAEVRAKINTPSSIDVVFSNGGLTRTNGHPVQLHAMLANRNVFPGMTADQMNGHAYFLVDSKEDLDVQWPRIAAGKPDFIKTFVLFSGTKHEEGLSAGVLQAIVERAHEDGLRVSSHVETAADFRIAVNAGVDEINHLPIPRPFLPLDAYVIDEATARHAAQRGVTVVPTVSVSGRYGPGMSDAERANTIANVRTLQKAGVKIAVGSDGISGELPMPTAVDEAFFLNKHGYTDNLSLLKMWTEETAATIFPKRKLGFLRDGYEASFLVLEGDPIAEFANVKKIVRRVKQGREL